MDRSLLPRRPAALAALFVGLAAASHAQAASRVPPMPSDFANWQTVPIGDGIYAFIAPDGVT
ncbi:MAG TPA: hypothetical protein VMT93_01620, partial [Gemmatimonadaceae bacterium]|nr:hypothetical protein [Gemmatimonadaceae bacterium]